MAGDGRWLPSRQDCLVHVQPLSGLFRAKSPAPRHQTPLFPLLDAHVWQKDWVVHGEPVGSGQETFRSRAPYIFRVAISTNRILQLEESHVTLQYKDSATAQTRYCTVRAEEFMRRFLHQVLSDRCVKVRSDGLLSPGHRQRLTKARALLGAGTIARNTAGKAPKVSQHLAVKEPGATLRCPTCGSPLILGQTLRPTGRWPP